MNPQQETENPFRPGTGNPPPWLAGREPEQDFLSRRLNTLLAGKPPESPIMLYGPRGTGKSALLEWFADECMKRGGVRVINDDADKLLASQDSALSALFPSAAVPKEYKVGLAARLFSVLQGRGEMTMRAIDARWTHLKQRLIDECGVQPLVVLVDEAHDVVDWQVYKGFISAVCGALKARAPIQLVLAGTPGLPDQFRTRLDGTRRGITGMERAKHIGLARISREAAAEAMRVPVEKGGRKIDAEVLDTVAQEANCYPFFLQCWGHALWEAASAQGRDFIAPRDIEDARTAAEEAVNEMYAKRYAELRSGGRKLCIAAVAVADAFQTRQDSMRENELMDAIQTALRADLPDKDEAHQAASDALDSLTLLDYIWRQPGNPAWVPGIPSLMSFTLAQEQGT